MGNLKSQKCQFWYTLLILVSIQNKAFCRTYQVGDLDAWGIPTYSNPQVYTKWSKSHNFTIGDSLFFLYPPSQDSLIQVTRENYNRCNLKDPILYMNNGNSLFNITSEGNFYFTSGIEGHCEKLQKLQILVGNGTYTPDDDPAYGPSADAPSYPTVFGAIPVQASSSPLIQIPVFISAAAGLLASLFVI